jgi:hypothetical protein
MGPLRIAVFLAIINLASPFGAPLPMGTRRACPGHGQPQMVFRTSVRQSRALWEYSNRVAELKAPELGPDIAGAVLDFPELVNTTSFTFEAAAWTMWGLEVPASHAHAGNATLLLPARAESDTPRAATGVARSTRGRPPPRRPQAARRPRARLVLALHRARPRRADAPLAGRAPCALRARHGGRGRAPRGGA